MAKTAAAANGGIVNGLITSASNGDGKVYPEGGWGWIVVVSVFLFHVIIHGLQLSYGVLLFIAADNKHYTANLHLLVWAGSFSYGLTHILSPIVCCLSLKYSPRIVALIGALLSSLGCLLTSQAREQELMFLCSHGALFGVGSAMCLTASTIVLCQYFKRRRSFVNCISHTGGGFGVALFSSLLHELNRRLSWSMSIGIVACFVASGIVLALVFQPIEDYLNSLGHTCERIKPTFRQTMPISNPCSHNRFLTYLALVGLAAFGFYVPCVMMVIAAIALGLSPVESVLVLVVYGVCRTVGAAITAAVLEARSRFKDIIPPPQIISQFFHFVAGVTAIITATRTNFRTLQLFAVIFGLCSGAARCLVITCTAELVGNKLFAHSWSLTCVSRGVGYLLGAPIILFVHDGSGFSLITVALVSSGGCLVLASLLQFHLWLCCTSQKVTHNKPQTVVAKPLPPSSLTPTNRNTMIPKIDVNSQSDQISDRGEHEVEERKPSPPASSEEVATVRPTLQAMHAMRSNSSENAESDRSKDTVKSEHTNSRQEDEMDEDDNVGEAEIPTSSTKSPTHTWRSTALAEMRMKSRSFELDEIPDRTIPDLSASYPRPLDALSPGRNKLYIPNAERYATQFSQSTKRAYLAKQNITSGIIPPLPDANYRSRESLHTISPRRYGLSATYHHPSRRRPPLVAIPRRVNLSPTNQANSPDRESVI